MATDTDTEPETLLADGQRIAVAGMAAMGVTFLAVGLLVPPRDAMFWVAFCLAPPFMACIAAILAITLGRRLDAWLLAGGAPRQAWRPAAVAALPETTRQALRVALVPALLGELARESVRLAAAEKDAAGRLTDAAVAAWNAAPDEAARLAIAGELPGLVAGLLAGAPGAADAAGQAAARLAARGPR